MEGRFKVQRIRSWRLTSMVFFMSSLHTLMLIQQIESCFLILRAKSQMILEKSCLLIPNIMGLIHCLRFL